VKHIAGDVLASFQKHKAGGLEVRYGLFPAFSLYVSEDSPAGGCQRAGLRDFVFYSAAFGYNDPVLAIDIIQLQAQQVAAAEAGFPREQSLAAAATLAIFQAGAALFVGGWLLEETFPSCSIEVEKVEHQSRADRFAFAQSIIEELRDEIQDWRDNLSENVQSETKAEELDDCIQSLEELLDKFGNVEFPSRF
jgi:hypothetical protein